MPFIEVLTAEALACFASARDRRHFMTTKSTSSTNSMPDPSVLVRGQEIHVLKRCLRATDTPVPVPNDGIAPLARVRSAPVRLFIIVSYVMWTLPPAGRDIKRNRE